MHTCEIAVSGEGPGKYEQCGLPATKNVLSHVTPAGAPRDEGHIIWMCDKHYAHAAKHWQYCEF